MRRDRKDPLIASDSLRQLADEVREPVADRVDLMAGDDQRRRKRRTESPMWLRMIPLPRPALTSSVAMGTSSCAPRMSPWPRT